MQNSFSLSTCIRCSHWSIQLFRDSQRATTQALSITNQRQSGSKSQRGHKKKDSENDGGKDDGDKPGE